MRTAESLLQTHEVVFGNPANLRGVMKVADLHVHAGGGGDTTAPAWRNFRAAVNRGLDVLAITNHNHVGYDKVSRIRDRFVRRGGMYIDVIRAAEVTARSHLTGQDRHVLVYGA